MRRRDLIRHAGSGAMVLGAAPLLWGNRRAWAGANDRVRVAVIGIHGMGQQHIQAYQKIPGVQVAALCDVDENQFAPVIKKHFTDRNLPAPKTYVDLRKLYEAKDIDAVSVVTPNHWHALAAIWAIQAGKHVSVEKPCCHNIYEGQKLVEAAKKYSKIVVQDGAEQRSNPCAQTAVKFMRDGGLGEVYMAKGICYKWRDTIGRKPDGTPPPGVSYDLWLGPAPLRPFNPNRFHYNWHWNWEYGNGDIGNQGVHEVDIARWGLGVRLPTRISAMGGHYLFNDDQQTPNHMMSIFEFPSSQGGGDRKKTLQFEVRGWITNDEGSTGGVQDKNNTYMTSAKNMVGNLFYGSKGYLTKNVEGWKVFLGRDQTPGPSGGGKGDHYKNFVDAVRAGDPRRVGNSIEEGFYSTALVHLANISYRLGRTLSFDPARMRFVGDPEADQMLTRKYRAPYVVPDKV